MGGWSRSHAVRPLPDRQDFPPRAAIANNRFVPPPLLRPAGGPRPNVVTPQPAEHRYVEREVLVLTRGAALAALRALEMELGLTSLGVAPLGLLGGDLHRYRLGPHDDVASIIAVLRSRAMVAAAEPNFRFSLEDDAAASAADRTNGDAIPPEMPIQYAVEVLHLREAHALAKGGGVRVAVIDSGLDTTNPEIGERIVDRFDAVGGAFAPHSHGTAMGGAIVAHRNLVGIAPNAELIAIRAFSGSSQLADGHGFDILRGLQFAVTHGARVVNMSFAGPRDSFLKQAIEEARRQGVVTIAAAGNGGPGAAPLYPAAEPSVIAVTATDANGAPFAGANRGSYIALAAPGVRILAPGLGNAVQICSGTSIATAEVSGIVALMLERHATATPDDIRRDLGMSARPLSIDQAAGGAGIVDAAAAIRFSLKHRIADLSRR
jgi:subtilisin family serine protease